MSDEPLSSDAPLRCFVVGPIGSKFAPIGDPARDIYEDALDVFEKVVQPACHAFGLDPVRADQIAATGEITEQVFRRLRDDEVVIADVSGGNPNVMYELGLRHTRPLLTIQIGEYGQLPFDVSAIRTIQFSRSERGLIDARKELQRALSAGLAESGVPVSATRVWNEDAEPSAQPNDLEPVEQHEASAELEEPEGLLDQLAGFEATMPGLSETTDRISGVVEEMGAIAVDSTATIQAANALNPSAQQRLTLVAKFASALQPKASELTELTVGFARDMSAVDQQLTGILDYLESNPSAAGDEIDSFLDAIPNLARSSRESMENFSQFKMAIDSMSSMSKLLRRPAKEISDAVDRMMDATLRADAWESQVIRIRKKRSASAEAALPGAPRNDPK
ncbi:hypothetical protein ACI3KX_00525 [Microbacterium sp. ZW CA_36]|uniref:hypothetical protein n=1 Tax=Microbacterium sp. ZW CA_36 TaxID=3378078 RepID=UPI0038541D7A